MARTAALRDEQWPVRPSITAAATRDGIIGAHLPWMVSTIEAADSEPLRASVAVSLRASVAVLESRQSIIQEAGMALARVVSFDGVTRDRIQELDTEMRGSEPPEGLPAKEIIVLHDADAEKSLVIVFFENEEDYRRGDEVLSAMPAGDTPGQRTAVAKYDVAIRMTV
jgi:hypothetical protein